MEVTRLKLWMELAANIKRVTAQLDDLHQFALRRGTLSHKLQPIGLQLLYVSIIDLVSVSMSLRHQVLAVKTVDLRAFS